MTKIEYQDGTTEEYGYDEWQNCIYEKNRRDAVTRRTFTEDGHKIKEEFANGLAINYVYDGNGNCTKEWDNAGGCTRYRYDENGNLAEKSILCDAKHAHYKTLRYGYRRNGSLQWEEDAEGNRTEYYFSTLEDPEDSQFVPRVCISPQGYEFRHFYDKIGRRLRTETVQGITEYRYNGLHYVSSIKDPEGNVKREERDNLGNLIRKYSGRQSGGRTSSVGYSYRYDYLDRLIWVRNPLGREKTFIRDGREKMNQALYTKLYENRLLKSDVQMGIFEECLNQLAGDFKEDDIVELCQILDDNTMEYEVMFGVIHLLETLSSEKAFASTIEGIVKIKTHSPIWAKTITYRCLNDAFSIEMINKILPTLHKEIKDGFYDLLSEIKTEDGQKFGDSINEINF